VGLRRAARNWEGDFYFVVEPGGTLTKPMLLYRTCGTASAARRLKCRTNRPRTRLSHVRAGATWKKVLTKKLRSDPGMVTGQLQAQGQHGHGDENVKAAKEWWRVARGSRRVSTLKCKRETSNLA